MYPPSDVARSAFSVYLRNISPPSIIVHLCPLPKSLVLIFCFLHVRVFKLTALHSALLRSAFDVASILLAFVYAVGQVASLSTEY
jgi:hypothetical protein